mmetsp:Transcript_15637/g.28449  ORF Transcript_15637/g.28449 Transcript_15637/m.28449 type:complete len:1128 (+) Transcript_15637:18-3401(+)
MIGCISLWPLVFTVSYAFKAIVVVPSTLSIEAGHFAENTSLKTTVLKSDSVLSVASQLDDVGPYEIIIDLSLSESYSHELKLECDARRVLYILAWNHELARKLKSFYPHISRDKEILALGTVLKLFKVPEANLSSDDVNSSTLLTEYLTLVEDVLVSPSTPASAFEELTSRVFKPSGVKTLILDLPADTLARFLPAIKKAKVYKEGFFYLGSRRASFLPFNKDYVGLVLLAEEGLETTNSWLQNEIQNLVWLTQGVTDQKGPSLEAFMKAKLDSRTFSLINFQQSGKVKVGSIRDQITSLVVYPGNVNKFDPSLTTKILVTTNSSPLNPNGTRDNINPRIFVGAFAAFASLKEQKFLGRFELDNKEVVCGASAYNKEFSKACIKKGLGVFHIGSYSTSSILSMVDAQIEIGDKTPVIGPITGTSKLTDKGKYPNFIRNRVSSKGYVPAMIQLLKKLGYDKINTFYSKEDYGLDFKGLFDTAFNQSGIQVMTPEADQVISFDFLQNTTNFTGIIESIKASEIRPVLVLLAAAFRPKFIEFLATGGFEKGQVVCLYLTSVSQVLSTWTKEQIATRMGVMEGSLFITQAIFQGKVGQQAKEEIEKYNVQGSDAVCQYYDASLMIAHAIKAMLLRGKDFEDLTTANQALRDINFYGCTGKFTIDRDTNDRRDQELLLYNVLSDGKGNYFDSLPLGNFFSRSSIFTEYASIVWPDGSTEVPSLHLYNYADCPFPEEYRHDFKRGLELVSYLSTTYFILTFLLLSFMVLKKKVSHSILTLEKPVEVSFQDRLVLGLVVIDMLQYIGHGPVFENGEDAIRPYIDYASGGTLSAIKFEKGVYWKVLNSVLCITLLWFILCCFIFLKLKRRNVRLFKGITAWAEMSMPLLGNAIFLPVISVLFDIFVCEEAHGPDKSSLEFEDSFMYRDCSEDCWSGSHMTYSTLATVSLLIYLPVTVLSRPVWQQLVPDLHVFTRPSFYIQKTFVEVSVVMLRRGLRPRNQIAHALVFLALISVHLAVSCLRKPFNYHRLNLWYCLAMVFVVIYSVLCTVQLYFDGIEVTMALSLMFGAGGLIVAVGLIVQCMHLPSLLVTKEELNLQEIFRFAFNIKNIKPPASLMNSRSRFKLPSARQPNLED